jgi:hypothetical protein
MTFPDGQLLAEREVFQSQIGILLGLKTIFKISFSNIFIMDANFAGLCENVNNFSKDGIFASDRC